jgi:hypothetical protein
MLRYCACIITRSLTESRLFAELGIVVLPPKLYARFCRPARVRSNVVDDDVRQDLAGLHLEAIEGPNSHLLGDGTAAARIETVEHVRGHVEPVGPDRHLRVVGEPGVSRIVGADRVEPPPSRERVFGLRDRDALVVGAVLEVRPAEVGNEEAIAQRVVDDGRIAPVGRVARSSGSCPTQSVLKVNASRRALETLSKMPIDVLTAWT